MIEYDIFRRAFLAQKAVDEAVNEVTTVSKFTKSQAEELLLCAAREDPVRFKAALERFRALQPIAPRVYPRMRFEPVRQLSQTYKGEDEMTVVQQLAAFDSNRADVHDMVDMVARAQGVKTEYERSQVPVPQALSDGIDRLRVEIETHKREAVQKRLREIAAQKTTLLSVTEKREALDKEEADLKASLEPKKADTPAT